MVLDFTFPNNSSRLIVRGAIQNSKETIKRKWTASGNSFHILTILGLKKPSPSA